MREIAASTELEIKKAAKALKAGHLVAFPTETVYGLGADATSESAVRRIYEIKGRPSNHPLIVHISSISQIDKWAIDIPDYARKLAREFWPGPLTLILKKNLIAKDFISGGQNFIGLRVPNEIIALSLLSEFEKIGGHGIAAPSANKFGEVSPTSAAHVTEDIGELLGKNDLILDGNISAIGIESTIIDCTSTQPSILRPGAVTIELIRESVGDSEIINEFGDAKIRTSGSLKSHYSPKARVLLNVKARPGNGFIAMSNIPTPKGSIRLAAPENFEMYANLLYSAFREGDRKGIKIIVVMTPIGSGLADAINDRLIKASSSKQLQKFN